MIVLFVAAGDGMGQTSVVHGTVSDASTGEPLAGANVRLLETPFGKSTSTEGTFELSVPAGVYTFLVSMIGYEDFETEIAVSAGDTTILDVLLMPGHVDEEEVVVTGTRTLRAIDDVPVRVEAIPQEEVEEKILMAPSTISMLLNESTGMRVQTTSATSSTANLRIQGLNGRYTQLLTDGVPNFGGLSAAFGLMQFVPLNIRQVEVIKGATSALYGADAIGGVVNFITKVPHDEPELHALLNTTSQRGVDGTVFYAGRMEGLGTTLMVSKNNQSRYDTDGDGFSDVAEFDRIQITPRFFYDVMENVRAQVTFGYMFEDRLGGAVSASRDAIGSGVPYLEQVDSRRFDVSTSLSWQLEENSAAEFKAAGMRLTRDAWYGSEQFNAVQTMQYVDGQFTTELAAHRMLFGGGFNAEKFDDRTAGVIPRSYIYRTPFLLVQDEITLSEHWSLVAGGRLDFHNEFGTFLTPRASVMFKPTPSLTLRAGGGTGFKAPTVFLEEAEETGFHNVRPLGTLEAERAVSASIDAHWKGIVGDVSVSANAALYFSRLDHPLLANEDSLAAGALVIENADSPTRTSGMEFSSQLSYDDFKLSLGYTFLYGTRDHGNERVEIELNPRHSFGAVLMWESDEAEARIGVEQYYTGPQRLERNPFRDRSPAYWLTGVLVEKWFGPVRFFLNFENIFDTRQTRFEPIVIGNVMTEPVRTLPVYAPLDGRVINGGIRIVL